MDLRKHFLLALAFLVCDALPLEGKPARKLEKIRDHPRQAARFLQLLRASKENITAAQGLPRALAHVAGMREMAARKAGQDPVRLALLAGKGVQLRLGGLPVGPLPAHVVQLPQTVEELQKLSQKELQKARLQLRPLFLPLSPRGAVGDWHWHGPNMIGGRTRALAMHRANPKVIWLGSVSGGLWRSEDQGKTWKVLSDFLDSMLVSCLAVDPSDPSVLYVGTGEGFYNGPNEMRGTGILRVKEGVAEFIESTKNHQNFQRVNRLAFSPDGKNLLAATDAGLFCWDGNTKTFCHATIVDEPNPSSDFTFPALDVRFDPADVKGLRCVAAGWNGNTWYSEKGGRVWKWAQGIPFPQNPTTADGSGRVELAYSAAEKNVVFASVDIPGVLVGTQQSYGCLYRSNDGGKSFILRGRPAHLGSQGGYANCLWVGDHIHRNLVIVGGLDLHRSDDGGITFTRISDWKNTPRSPHADHHIIMADPGYNGQDNRRVYCANDGGLYLARDIYTVSAQAGWECLNNGLGITQFYGAAIHSESKQLLGGTQDNGTLLLSTPKKEPDGWKDLGIDCFNTGDGGYCAIDQEKSLFYSEYTFLQLQRSDGHKPYQRISATIEDAGVDGLALFIAPFLLHPGDPRIMLAGGARLWRSEDVREDCPHFTKVKDFLYKLDPDRTRPDPLDPNPTINLISALAVPRNKTKSGVVWVGYAYTDKDPLNSGAIFHCSDITAVPATWRRQGARQLPIRHCTRIALDPACSDTVYALFGGYASDNLWRSTNGGENWSAVGQDVLPKVPFFDLAVHPDEPQRLYLATEVGLFLSVDGGNFWTPTSATSTSAGPTNCAVYQLFWDNRTLYCATFGRGIFSAEQTAERQELRMKLTTSVPR